MARLPTHDLYDLLGVPPDADVAAIRRAWKVKLRQLHPDGRPEHEQAQAHEQAVRLNEARDILTDHFRRADYDQSQRRARTSPSSPPPPKPSPPPPPPPPPRLVVLDPQVVDFGDVATGQVAPDQRVTVRMSDGSVMDQVAVLNHWGRYWVNEQYEEQQGVPEFVVWFRGREISANLEPGPHTDWVQLDVEGERARVELRITVTAPPPPRPAEPEPAAEPTPAPGPPPWTPSAWSRFVAVLVMASAILAVLIMVGGVPLPGDSRETGPAPQATATAPAQPATGAPAAASRNATTSTSPFCRVTSVLDGSTSYYRTVPGTTTPAGDQPVWTMAPPSDDPYLTWKSAGFGFWERINKSDGFTVGGQVYRAGTYVELHVILEEPWERLSPALLRQYPGIDASVEAAQRAEFIQEWSQQLGSPGCG
ncbi:hypothetical protein VM98_24865 [Streptomyces rubellomurinus subsp. indigoferus]|nr:hypothetical protein VM98_24865 [Streptomyces rubellomurinus subsp. indigoferus]